MLITKQADEAQIVPPAGDHVTFLQQINAKFLQGTKELTDDEQATLYKSMDSFGEAEMSVLADVAAHGSNLSLGLTFKFVSWFYQHGDISTSRDLLKERLKDTEGAEGDLMDVGEVSMLTDCQIVLEVLEKAMNLR